MRGTWGIAVWAAVAATLAAGCASTGAKTAPAKPGDKSAAAKPGTAPAAKPAAKAAPAPAKAPEAKAAPAPAKAPETKPAAAATGTKPADGAKAAPDASKAAAPAAGAGAGAAAAGGGGMWASYDAWAQRTGTKLEESKFLGMRVRPRLSEELDYTDNAYYQDKNEQVVVNLDPNFNGIPANPKLGTPRGKVAEIVNVASVGVGLEMKLNTSLVPLVGKGSDSFRVFDASVTSVEYLKHSDSPTALNWNVHVDAPALINELLSHLRQIDASRNAFYVRLEGDYSKVTDPLDVARFQAQAANPTFFNSGPRSSFTRRERYVKGTIGWQGPIFDSKVSYEDYRLTLDDVSLNPADHDELTWYGEIGYRVLRSEHRVYGFYETTVFNFDDRGDPSPLIPNNQSLKSLRDFVRYRTGLGWEGPIASKKIHGGAELYYVAMRVLHDGGLYTHPIQVDPETGQGLRNGAGNLILQPLGEPPLLAGKANVTYRPFLTKGTQLTAEYSRNMDWSVVAEDKVVDKGSITFTHPINERLTGEVSYNVSFENVAYREKRLYNELAIGVRYKLAAYTEAYARYTIRHMRSRREPVTTFSDAANEPFLVRADGDFTANILAIGISIAF